MVVVGVFVGVSTCEVVYVLSCYRTQPCCVGSRLYPTKRTPTLMPSGVYSVHFDVCTVTSRVQGMRGMRRDVLFHIAAPVLVPVHNLSHRTPSRPTDTLWCMLVHVCTCLRVCGACAWRALVHLCSILHTLIAQRLQSRTH